MNVSDPIADMLTRIRNASRAHHLEVVVPASRVKREIARILTPDGPAGVDFRWEGSTLELLPVAELPAGERLVLSLRGELSAADGP